MKARWTHADYMEMGHKPLSFTEEDVQLIRFGLARRGNTGTLGPRLRPVNTASTIRI